MPNLILRKNDIYIFLSSGMLNGLFLGMMKHQVINLLGMPDNYEPQKKLKKGIMGYGGLNIYLFNGLVNCFSLSTLSNQQNNIITLEKISKNSILKFVNTNELSLNKTFEFDDIEYFQMDNKKLGFLNNILVYVSSGM